MSSEAPDQDSKTEDPSQKKLEDAHKKGDVAKSQEVTTWFMLMGSGIVFALLSPWISSSGLQEQNHNTRGASDQTGKGRRRGKRAGGKRATAVA